MDAASTRGQEAPIDANHPTTSANPSTRKGPKPAAPGAGRVIAMLNQKGGVGKTTSTVNLGAALAAAGRKVCLIDLDPQAHLTLHLGIEVDPDRGSVYDLLIDPERAAKKVIVSARENLDCLPAETDLAAVETELAGVADRYQILAQKFAAIQNRYEIVLIDCPPSLGLLTLNALALAREVFVPMQAHFLALQGVGKLLQTVGLVCGNVNPQLRVTGIILCMHEKQTTLSREVVSDLDQFFAEARTQKVPWRDCRLLKPPIRRNVKLAEAPSFGKTIFDYEPACPGADDYRALAAKLMQEWDAVGANESIEPARELKPAAMVEIVTKPAHSEYEQPISRR